MDADRDSLPPSDCKPLSQRARRFRRAINRQIFWATSTVRYSNVLDSAGGTRFVCPDDLNAATFLGGFQLVLKLFQILLPNCGLLALLPMPMQEYFYPFYYSTLK